MESSPPGLESLNYHHLRYFWLVAKEGSVRGAAEKLHVSQPSICTQIKLLEAALGAPLFRRSGRRLVLTDFGEFVAGYAEEIFALGRELVAAANRSRIPRIPRLHVGVVDSFPKLLSLDFLRPAFTLDPPIQLSCREGKLDELLAQLATHRLDAVLSDEPTPPGVSVKTFNHPLGSSGITFCAAPGLAKKLTGRFPQNLDGAPGLLPTRNTMQRRDLDDWFRREGVQPLAAGEFEDGALAKVIAADGHGFVTVPSTVEEEAVGRYGFEVLGRTDECRVQLFLITAERRLEHPAIAALAQQARRGFSSAAARLEAQLPAKRATSLRRAADGTKDS